MPEQMEEDDGRSSSMPIPRAGMPTIWVFDEWDNIQQGRRLGRSRSAPPAPPAAMPMGDAAREAARLRVAAAMERLAVAAAMARWLGGAAPTLHDVARSFL